MYLKHLVHSLTWRKYPKTQVIVVAKAHFHVRANTFGQASEIKDRFFLSLGT